MSSRLFQNIRERQGLAYAIYSDLILPRHWLLIPSTPEPPRICRKVVRQWFRSSGAEI